MRLRRRLLGDDDGTTSVEYAVILALILAAIMASVAVFGQQTNTLWGQSNKNLEDHGFGS